MLVKCEVVVSKFALVASHVTNKSFVLTLVSEVRIIVFVDVLDLLVHFGNLCNDFLVFLLKQVSVVVAVVNLAPWPLALLTHTNHAMVGDWSVN